MDKEASMSAAGFARPAAAAAADAETGREW